MFEAMFLGGGMRGLTIENIQNCRRGTGASAATLSLNSAVEVNRCIPMCMNASGASTGVLSSICTLTPTAIEVPSVPTTAGGGGAQDISVVEFSNNVTVYVHEGSVGTASITLDLNILFGIEEEDVISVFPFVSGTGVTIGRPSIRTTFSEDFMQYGVICPRADTIGSQDYKAYFAVGFK